MSLGRCRAFSVPRPAVIIEAERQGMPFKDLSADMGVEREKTKITIKVKSRLDPGVSGRMDQAGEKVDQRPGLKQGRSFQG